MDKKEHFRSWGYNLCYGDSACEWGRENPQSCCLSQLPKDIYYQTYPSQTLIPLTGTPVERCERGQLYAYQFTRNENQESVFREPTIKYDVGL